MKDLHQGKGKTFIDRTDNTRKAILDVMYSKREVGILVIAGKDKDSYLTMSPHSFRKHWKLEE